MPKIMLSVMETIKEREDLNFVLKYFTIYFDVCDK